MIYLRTGLPGASKTLNSLRELVVSYDAERPKFYNNIKLLMLDIEVCKSFSGWFYGWYFPRLKDTAAKKKLIKIMKPIHDDGEFLSLSDAPWLQTHFESHNQFDTWLYWVQRVYPKKAVEKLKLILSAADDDYPDKFELVLPLNLHFQHFEDPHKWMQLPKRSIILIDECQQFFPPRANGSRVPDAIAALETHRHGGYDLHFITQDRTLCDANLRKLVGKHIHFFNPFGGARVTRKEAQKTFDPNDYHDSKQATKKVIKRDKSFYGVYWSAEIHTHKGKIPMMFYVGLFLIFGIAFAVYTFSNKFLVEKPKVETAIPAASTSTASKDTDSTQPANLEDQLKLQLSQLVKDVYISGSIMRVGTKFKSFEYVFYRSTDDAIFDPYSIGLIVEPMDKCLANIKLGGIVYPITCNPFYVRQVVEDNEESNDNLEGLSSNPDKHKPNIKLF